MFSCKKCGRETGNQHNLDLHLATHKKDDINIRSTQSKLSDYFGKRKADSQITAETPSKARLNDANISDIIDYSIIIHEDNRVSGTNRDQYMERESDDPSIAEGITAALNNLTSDEDVQCLSEFYACTGYKPKLPGSFTQHYPFDIHDQSLDLEWIYGYNCVFAKYCLKRVTKKDTPCVRCANLAVLTKMKELEERAKSNSLNGLPRIYWTKSQTINQLDKVKAVGDRHRMDVFTASRKISLLTKAVEMYDRFKNLLSTNDVPRLRHLLNTMAKSRRSMSAVVDKLRDAVQGVYHARQYEKRDLQIGYLVWKLSGPRLLYALNHSLGLPSVTTIYRNFKSPNFIPLHTLECKTEILAHNVQEALGIKMKQPENLYPEDEQIGYTRSPNIMMTDETAIDCRVRFDPRTNSVIGLCAEHCSNLNLKVETLPGLELVADAVRNDNTHIAKEALVIAISNASKDDYAAVPIIAQPTCKRMTVSNQRDLFENILDYHDTMLSRHLGPVFLVATDGDATRRRALHQLLASSSFGAEHNCKKLHDTLSKLPLFDLACGKDGTVAIFDMKHIWKRLRGQIINGKKLKDENGSVIPKISTRGITVTELIHILK